MSGGTLAEHQPGNMKPEHAEIFRMLLSLELDMVAADDPSNPANEPDDEDEQSRYARRNSQVLLAMGHAMILGYRVGFLPDPAEPGWTVGYIDLPSGQVSWHFAEYPEPWDGHTTEQKYARIQAFRALTDAALDA